MTYQVAPHHRLFRTLIRPVFRGIFHLFSPVTISGQENVPSQGPYLVVFNHVSIYDPPLLVAFWPKPLEILGASDVWQRPGQSTLAQLYGAIPVRRGELDRQAIGKMVSALQDGRPLLVAPEGGRSHVPGLRQAKSGVIYLLEKTGVPVLPVGVVGTTDDFMQKALKGERPRLEIRIGPSFRLPEQLNKIDATPHETRQRKVDFIMVKIAGLLPDNYRGWYTLPTHKFPV